MAETSISSRDRSEYTGASEIRTPASAKTKEAGASAVEQTKEIASSVVQRMGNMASTIGHKAEGAVESVGGEMKSLAGTIRDNAPEGGVFGSAASGVASTLESGGAYLQEHNLHGVAEDATALIRRYPLQAILAGIGVGFLVGRASRS